MLAAWYALTFVGGLALGFLAPWPWWLKVIVGFGGGYLLTTLLSYLGCFT